MTQYIERYWRDATPADAIKDPPMVARFGNGKEWQHDAKLSGMRRDSKGTRIWYGFGDMWTHCQVYDAPDPGEGWRLIDVDKEPLREGDEFMLFFDRKRGWTRIDTDVTNWAAKHFNRRRIEPPKPKYEPFRWEDREQLRGRWVRREEDSGVTFETLIEKIESDGRRLFLINGYTAKQMLNSWRFMDTGEPVGRKVE